MSIQEKVAIITGAGRGIGAATAELLSQNGAHVVLASRSPNELHSVKEKIDSSNGSEKTIVIPTDISDPIAVKNLFTQTQEELGSVDILVNNAGYIDAKEFTELSLENWKRTIDINLTGTFLCCQEAFQQMTKSSNGGSIVNISSLGGVQSTEKFKGFSAYSSAKAGVIALTECLAVEGKPHGIRVNCIAPGAVNTVMLKSVAPQFNPSTQPVDIAKIIAYLVDTEQSGVMNGSVLEIHSNE